MKAVKSPLVEVTDSEEMNKKLVERNTHHLHQAKATPFADCELGKRLGWDGQGELCETILQGRNMMMPHYVK